MPKSAVVRTLSIMKAARLLVVSCMAAAAALLAASETRAERAANDAGAATTLPACVSVTTEARYVPYGYNHVVIVKNGCLKAATCSVATDVSPQATSVEVSPATTLEVLTFSASPAQTFIARVSCTLH